MRRWAAAMVATALVFGAPACAGATAEQEAAGAFFGDPVPVDNYYFVMRTVLSFNTPWGGIPTDREKLERRVWDDLLLSFEAYRRGITVSEEDLDKKIRETLKSGGETFDWKGDPVRYAEWTKETLGVSTGVFESQMRHLVQIEKLYAQVRDGIDLTVTDEEAFQEFMNEHNNLSVEVALFDTLPEAQAFYQKALNDSGYWDQQAEKDREKERGEKTFRRPGFVALEFLMSMWKFPKDAVYEMIEMEAGAIHSPEPVYEGYGVFKVLKVGRADKGLFPKRRAATVEQLRRRNKYEGFQRWLEDLRDEADVQVYLEVPADIVF